MPLRYEKKEFRIDSTFIDNNFTIHFDAVGIAQNNLNKGYDVYGFEECNVFFL